MATIKVFWAGKFGGRAVTIEEADFNPEIHRLADGSAPPPAPEAIPEPEQAVEEAEEPARKALEPKKPAARRR